MYFGDVHCKQNCHELSIWAQAQPPIWIFLLMGSFTATQAQTKTRKAQIVFHKFENTIDVVFLKKLYLKNIKIIFFYFLKINFDINKLK
jgi:hypothetical protein